MLVFIQINKIIQNGQTKPLEARTYSNNGDRKDING